MIFVFFLSLFSEFDLSISFSTFAELNRYEVFYLWFSATFMSQEYKYISIWAADFNVS